MSRFYTSGTVELCDRRHTWKDNDGNVYSALIFGPADIVFDSAEDARQVAARCLEIADAIEALKREGAAGKDDTDD